LSVSDDVFDDLIKKLMSTIKWYHNNPPQWTLISCI